MLGGAESSPMSYRADLSCPGLQSRIAFLDLHYTLGKGVFMIHNYTPSSFETITEYNIVFDDGHHNGFAFSCNKDGTIFKDLSPEAYANYKYCLESPEKFVRFNKVIASNYRVRNNAHGICHCGARIELVDMYYGACQCDKCGQWYNLFGQELLPPEEWEENLEGDY